jgi:hypothetical protein
MDPVANTRLNSNVCELAHEELAHVAGGMINLREGQEAPTQGHGAGQLVSMIGYRTFADVGL